jgi:hypothetical protein
MSRVVGWKLDPDDRDLLLARFPPRYADTDADHVTLESGSPTTKPLPSQTAGEVVGRADDGESLECLVVAIGGTTARPDGSTYHITWSLDRAAGRRAQESNDVLADLGWAPVDAPVPIRLIPASWAT